MSTYSLIAGLPVVVDSYELEGLEQAVSSDFVRRTTVVRLRGAGEEGVGEDVDLRRRRPARGFQAAGPVLDLAGDAHARLALGPVRGPARSPPLGLRERRARPRAPPGRADACTTCSGASRSRSPSSSPPSLPDGTPGAPARRCPGMRFKLDPRATGTRRSSTSSPRSTRRRGRLQGGVQLARRHERTPPPSLYRLVVEALPDALIEDPDVTDPEKAAILEPHRDRITWDALIHSVADVDALPFPPKVLNSKPSRFGSVPRAVRLLRHLCRARDRAVRRRPVRARPRPRPDPVPRVALPPGTPPNDVAPGEYNLVPAAAGPADEPACRALGGTGRFSLVAGTNRPHLRLGVRCPGTSIRAWTRTSASGSGAGRR